MPTGLVNPLDQLRTRLESSFSSRPYPRDSWSEPEAMTKILAQVRAHHDGPGLDANSRTVDAAVAHFREHGQPDGWRGLKYTCFGAGSPDKHGWCLLSELTLREKLFALAQAEVESRRKIKCFQALLFCYWAFPRATAKQDALVGWTALRGWLASQLPLMESLSSRKPEWFSMLSRHANLLRENPCDRYGPKLFVGDGAEFGEIIKHLGIPSDSWVQEEAVIAQMKIGISLSDNHFKNDLHRWLSLAMGCEGITPSKSLQTRCLAMLVSRYARCSDRPEHMALCDAAVSIIGNPWLYRASWDAHVTDDQGIPNADAREMINAWLKRSLIKYFFELLSADGAGDTRRLDYWLRFEPIIGDMWFALGAEARSKRGESFDKFRERAKGRLLDLRQTTSDNNAFIMRMRIGEFVAIEFGAPGNALYVYQWAALPQEVTQKLMSQSERSDVTIHQLKSKDDAMIRKLHRDSLTALESWEQKFDQELCPLIGYHPEQRPAFMPDIESLLARYSVGGKPIKCEDHRPRGGALWVYVDDSHAVRSLELRGLQFSYRTGRGWYRE
ncbi:MAG: hypothetical protein HQL74_13780 [Magnetococcales bacterium]|nr:hypothetical protein [Magnetococcales bacterium]